MNWVGTRGHGRRKAGGDDEGHPCCGDRHRNQSFHDHPGFRSTLHHLVRERLAAASPPMELRQLPYHPKSVRDIANVGIVSEARHRAQILGLAVECSAAQDAQPALAARPCRAVVRCAAIIVVPAIFDPFGRIACRVIKTERVRFVRTDRSRLLNVAGVAFSAIGLTGADVPAPPVRGIRSASGRVLPFSFGRKPIGPPGPATARSRTPWRRAS